MDRLVLVRRGKEAVRLRAEFEQQPDRGRPEILQFVHDHGVVGPHRTLARSRERRGARPRLLPRSAPRLGECPLVRLVRRPHDPPGRFIQRHTSARAGLRQIFRQGTDAPPLDHDLDLGEEERLPQPLRQR